MQSDTGRRSRSTYHRRWALAMSCVCVGSCAGVARCRVGSRRRAGSVKSAHRRAANAQISIAIVPPQPTLSQNGRHLGRCQLRGIRSAVSHPSCHPTLYMPLVVHVDPIPFLSPRPLPACLAHRSAAFTLLSCDHVWSSSYSAVFSLPQPIKCAGLASPTSKRPVPSSDCLSVHRIQQDGWSADPGQHSHLRS